MKANAKWMGMAAMAAGAAVVLVGMAGQAAAGSSASLVTRRLTTQTLERSANGEFLAPVALVANNRRQWDKLMADLEARGQLLVSPARSGAELAQIYGIDWGKQSIVLVSLGEVPTAGEELEVIEVRRTIGNKLDIRVAVRSSDLSIQAVTAPYHLLVIEQGQWSGGELSYESSPNAMMPAMPASLSTDSSRDGGLEVRLTLGAMKADYR